jgi:hypothetical protein
MDAEDTATYEPGYYVCEADGTRRLLQWSGVFWRGFGKTKPVEPDRVIRRIPDELVDA